MSTAEAQAFRPPPIALPTSDLTEDDSTARSVLGLRLDHRNLDPSITTPTA
jgi:hypothetical protein